MVQAWSVRTWLCHCVIIQPNCFCPCRHQSSPHPNSSLPTLPSHLRTSLLEISGALMFRMLDASCRRARENAARFSRKVLKEQPYIYDQHNNRTIRPVLKRRCARPHFNRDHTSIPPLASRNHLVLIVLVASFEPSVVRRKQDIYT